MEIKDYGTQKGTVFNAQKARPMRPIEVTKVESRNYIFGSCLDLKFLDFHMPYQNSRKSSRDGKIVRIVIIASLEENEALKNCFFAKGNDKKKSLLKSLEAKLGLLS